jgi:hypothetical protein
MSKNRPIGTRDAAGAGCLISLPILLGVGFFQAMKFAKKKEHELAHQVEDVELEGEAGKLLEEKLTGKEALQRWVAKLEKTTEQFSKMGGRFSPTDFERQKEHLQHLRGRVADDPECKTLLGKAERCLQQYQPQG